MTDGMIFDIKRYSINDGPGIRTTVFLKGCPLSCWWCHNPESQRSDPEIIYRVNRCRRCAACVRVCPQEALQLTPDGLVTNRSRCDICGMCAQVCYYSARERLGYNISIDALLTQIERDIPFFDQSSGGVTFSGGEPLLQPEFLAEALHACRMHEIHTTVDTCGLADWEVFQRILPDVNLFLYDLKLMDAELHQRYTGATNELILNNLRILSEHGAAVIVRIPLIPGVNDDEENLHKSGEFLSGLPHPVGVELIGYHEIAQTKYEGLGMPYRAADIKPPSKEAMHKASEILSQYVLQVTLR
ncbi:MAG TPA: glycyl-radical enzyme activating protein [Longilinea sp.]|nr:glycyl-radical enzyme activating protein [Longilinea sp.]